VEANFHCLTQCVKNGLHNVGGAIISVRPEVEYFSFKMADSIQDWRKRWFYIKDEKSLEEQKFGLASFDPKKEVKKLKSWDHALSAEELEETNPLMAQIQTLQHEQGKKLSGL
jgi:hypothetical protein